MKTVKYFLVTIGIVLSAIFFNSCLDDDDYSLGKFWVEVMTVVPQGENSYYLRADDGKTFWPAATNLPYYKVEEEYRVIANYTILGDSSTTSDKNYNYYVKVNSLKKILTKDIAESKGEKNDSIYGKDPVEIVGLWTGDDYLNIQFRTVWGGVVKHYVNLIPSEDEDAMLEFRHNAYDDPESFRANSLVAFDLSGLDSLGLTTETDTLTLTLKVNTFDGDKVYKVKYGPKTKSQSKATNMEELIDNDAIK